MSNCQNSAQPIHYDLHFILSVTGGCYPALGQAYILKANGFGVTKGSTINGWLVQALPIDRINVFSEFQEESVWYQLIGVFVMKFADVTKTPAL